MAGFQERVSVVIDVISDKATSGLAGFRKSVADADGLVGKFKAGSSSAFKSIGANAGLMAVAAGSALVGFGAKALGAFTDLALSAGKFADATGITVDEASRWIEVSGDLGIGADAIQSSLQKMNKAIADGKGAFEEYNIEIVRTADGQVDANATFQNAVTVIGAIEDPTLRAKAAQEVFGKSYGEIAELMNMSAEDLKTALQGVSDQKVIDEEELTKAREYRERMDGLKDTFEDVTLEVGELVSELSPLLQSLASGVKTVLGWASASAKFVFGTNAMTTEVEKFWESINTGGKSSGAVLSGFMTAVNESIGNKSVWTKAGHGWQIFGDSFTQSMTGVGDLTVESRLNFEDFRKEFEKLAEQSPETAEQLLTDMGTLRNGTGETSEKFREWADYVGLTDERIIELANDIPDGTGAVKDLGEAADGTSGNLNTLKSSADKAKESTEKLEAAWQNLKDELSDDNAWLDVQDAFDDVKAKSEAAWIATATGAADAEQINRDYQKSLNDLTLNTIDYAQEVLGLPLSRATELKAMLAAGQLDEVERQLAILTRNREMNISIIAKGGIGYGALVDPRYGSPAPRAAGGGVESQRPYLVGEKGPEVIVPGSSGTVYSSTKTAALMGGGSSSGTYYDNRVFNISLPSQTPESLARNLARYNKRNGF